MSRTIPVFAAERRDGVADAVAASSSVAYLSPIRRPDPASIDEARASRAAAVASSSAAEDFTLIHFEDILATVGWNLNADVFLAEELWPARHTIDNKPINLGHKYLDIVGHVVSSSAVDADYQAIADDSALDELPDLFHVKNESVLYRLVGDKDRDEYMANLEAEIAAGEWFVSMESFFSGFDYGIKAPDGSRAVLRRSNATAFLTKHLRQYGGDGVYVDPVTGGSFTLGRVMRNIHFKGKGVVRRPGNPDSVIFSKVDAFKAEYVESGYVIGNGTSPRPRAANQEPETMTETEAADLRRQLDAAERKIQKFESENSTKAIEAERRDAQELRDRVAALESDLKDAGTARDAALTEIAAKEAQVSTISAERDAAAGERDALAEKLSAVESELAEKAGALAALSAEKAAAARRDAVVTAGADSGLADRLVARLAHLDDEAFAAFVEDLRPTFATKPAPATKPAAKASRAESGKAAIDEAEAEDETDLSAAGADGAETARAEVIDWFSNTHTRQAGKAE